MPTIQIHPPAAGRANNLDGSQLPLVLSTPSGLALLEIQGTINAPSATEHIDSDTTATPIGRVVFPFYDHDKPADDTAWHKRVYLYIGKHQQLTGEVKKLPNPIAIIRRREHDGASDELEIAEIVRYKLLFAHRPEPVGGGIDGSSGSLK